MTYELSTPLPSLRLDLDLVEVMPGIVALYDGMGYTDSSIRLPTAMIDLLFQGGSGRTIAEVLSAGGAPEKFVDQTAFIDIVNLLDDEGFFETPEFYRRRDAIHREYNSLPVRPPAHAGYSYPENPNELREVLDQYLAEGSRDIPTTPPTGLFVPHIDPRVGGSTYGPGYNAIRATDADTFVILGVPHTMSYDRFMFSRMDFDTPIGRVETDREFIDDFRRNLSFTLTTDEAAHMNEHSIEFQTIFLRHLFTDRPIRIVPILLGPLSDYVETGHGGVERDEAWGELIQNLKDTAERLGRKVCWIASVDFCHVGRKFGDDYDAKDVFSEVRQHDLALIERAVEGDPDGFIRRLVENQNKYKVCGVSPMHALLRLLGPGKGELYAYDQWDESERDSGVSFASVALYR